MNNIIESVDQAVAYIQAKSPKQPLVGVVLGTGLGELPKQIAITDEMAYQEIPGFVQSTVEFHKGSLICGTAGTVPVVLMQGRFHYYEGYSMQEITFPVRVMKGLGIKFLLLSNAAGGLNPDYQKGDLVIIDDHINLQPEHPLRGVNEPALGNRFVDMREPYHQRLNELLAGAFKKYALVPKKGVYVSVTGPSLETRAEYRWLRNCGADMVGMSTVPEVIVAAQLGLPCAAVSVITDECDPDQLQPVNIAEIIEIAGKADKTLSKIFLEVISKLP